MIHVAPVKPENIQLLYQLICEYAEESGNRAEVTTTPEKLLNDGFGAYPAYQAYLAWEGQEAVGFALFFPMYSSWKGHRTLYLEDLYVRPLWRRRQIGKQLFRSVMEKSLKTNANLAWECNRDDMRLRHSFVSMGSIDRAHKVSFYMESAEMRDQLRDASGQE